MKFGKAILVTTAILGAALFARQALAQDLDTPTVSQIAAKASTVRLAVRAGASGAQAGFTVEWMLRSQYDANGGWPDASDARILRGDFTGVPVWVVQGNAGDYTLPPAMWEAVELGELFDESGVAASAPNELLPSTDYAVRVTAKSDGTMNNSAPSATIFVSTSAQVQNCTFTIGFWKTHPGAWPVSSLTIGTVTYSAADLLSILNTPAGGNGLLILAHQLIAAKLSIANGADGSSVATDIANADALIGGLICPPIGSDTLSPASVIALATTLDNFNNGLIGPGHCADTPAKVTTWGSIKADYRR
jgi:hypothetical protein